MEWKMGKKGEIVIAHKPDPAAKKRIEYMCSQCGRREVRAQITGRPEPGTCPKSPSKRAHRWVKNRTMS